MKTHRLTFRIDDEMFKDIEDNIGYRKKSSYIRELIKKDIERLRGISDQ